MLGERAWARFFYAISIGLLTAAFWTKGLAAFTVLGILTMTWGDGMAAIIGQSFGRHPYQVWDMTKSWEGTSAMFLVSFIIGGAVLGGVYGLTPEIGAIALFTALTATVLESFFSLGYRQPHRAPRQHFSRLRIMALVGLMPPCQQIGLNVVILIAKLRSNTATSLANILLFFDKGTPLLFSRVSVEQGVTVSEILPGSCLF